MNIPFWKMQGASNDFLLVDDREQTFPVADAEWLGRIGRRRTGVGCEGIILIQPSRQADFRMRFFNPDGQEVDMCGNGARCVARLAHELGVAGETMRIETVAGMLRAEVLRTSIVRLGMTDPHGWELNGLLDLGDRSIPYCAVNTGVPHVVVESEDLAREDVVGLGRAIRRHAAFAPAGTNANFMAVTGPHAIDIRTFERGVEDETLACGTGIVAAALIASRLAYTTPPVQVRAASGDTLIVDFRFSDAGVRNVTLEGPAEHVYRGTLAYETPVRRDA